MTVPIFPPTPSDAAHTVHKVPFSPTLRPYYLHRLAQLHKRHRSEREEPSRWRTRTEAARSGQHRSRPAPRPNAYCWLEAWIHVMTAACLLRGLLEPFFGDVLLQVPRCVSGLPQLSLLHYASSAALPVSRRIGPLWSIPTGRSSNPSGTLEDRAGTGQATSPAPATKPSRHVS